MNSYFNSRRTLIPILTVILLIYSLIFIDLKWWYPINTINFINFGVVLILILCFEFFAFIFINYYQKDSILKLRNHIVINGLIKRKYEVLFIHFPLTMVFEEIVFRLFIFTFLLQFFGYALALIISSLIFGFYHIHTWFEFKDKKITVSFIIISINLGLILGACLYYLGIIMAILVHWFMSYIIFYFVKKRL